MKISSVIIEEYGIVSTVQSYIVISHGFSNRNINCCDNACSFSPLFFYDKKPHPKPRDNFQPYLYLYHKPCLLRRITLKSSYFIPQSRLNNLFVRVARLSIMMPSAPSSQMMLEEITVHHQLGKQTWQCGTSMLRLRVQLAAVHFGTRVIMVASTCIPLQFWRQE